MIPFIEISENESDNGVHKVRFENVKSDIIVSEYYCVNKGCTCTQVLFSFSEMDDEEKVISDPFLSLRMDYKIWEVVEVDKKDPLALETDFVKQFSEGINQDFKQRIVHHANTAQIYAEQKKQVLDATFIREGATVGYVEIFGAEDKLRFELDHYEVLLDDAYCMDPKCMCDHVIINFMELKQMKEERRLGAIQYQLKKNKYEVLDQNCGQAQFDRLVDHFINVQQELIPILRNRYNMMKKEGRRIIALEHETKQRVISTDYRIGRNDPCHCGSGRKFKKCCG